MKETDGYKRNETRIWKWVEADKATSLPADSSVT